MVKNITDPANKNYDFGQEFNYAVWAQNTEITLTNVPWNNDYRDVCSFPDDSGRTLDQYIDANESANIVIDQVSYLKFGQPVKINIPFNRAFKFNYLRVQNPAQPIPGSDELKSYYYFILDVKYLAPNTTELTIQLDIFSSFRNDFTLGNSYIERGHIGIANENAFDNYGRDWLTVPEGVDYGGEYRIINRKHQTIMGLVKAVIGSEDVAINNFHVLVVSTVDLSADAGTVDAPKLVTASGSGFEGLASGASYYVFNSIGAFQSFLSNFADRPWVTQGIISIALVPKLSRYQAGFVATGGAAPTPIGLFTPGVLKHGIYNDWRNDPGILEKIPARYRHLKKFLTYPYMVIEMTTWTGTPIILKPESWTDPNATVVERATFTPPNQRIEFFPRRYNAIPGSDIDNIGHMSTADVNSTEIVAGQRAHGDWIEGGDDGGEYLDLVTKIANFPTMALVNNGAIGYLASNAHGIAYQNQSADWSQTRALRGNETSYDQNARGISTSRDVNALQRAGMQGATASQNLLLQQQQAVSGIGGVINAGASAGLGATNGTIGLGGITQAVGNQVIGSIMTGNQVEANDRASNLSQVVSKGSNAAQNSQASYVNDTNRQLADWAARGDYENTIAGINAKVNDAALTQPTTSGQVGGETINMVSGNVEISLRWKFIDNAAVRRVGEYFLRYGYAVRTFGTIPDSLMVMSKFTYWKLQETYINSSTMPESFKQIIRGIFEKGVTVWANPDDIGNIDIADNTALPNVVL